MNPSNSPSGARVQSLGFVGDLWRQRELLWQFTLRNVEMRHRGSHLGFIWSVLNPLLMLGLYVFVFGYVFQGRFNSANPESHIDYALGMFLGLTLFHLFAEVIGGAPATILANPNFVKKVVFPLEILPASNVAASVFHATISLVLALTGIAFFGPGLSVQTLWLPVILLPLLLHLLAIAWTISAIGVFFRDIGQVTGFASMVLLYASCVFYSSSILPGWVWAIFRFNPLLLAVELARTTVMWHGSINPTHMIYLYVSGAISSVAGYWVFRKTAPAFADVL